MIHRALPGPDGLASKRFRVTLVISSRKSFGNSPSFLVSDSGVSSRARRIIFFIVVQTFFPHLFWNDIQRIGCSGRTFRPMLWRLRFSIWELQLCLRGLGNSRHCWGESGYFERNQGWGEIRFGVRMEGGGSCLDFRSLLMSVPISISTLLQLFRLAFVDRVCFPSSVSASAYHSPGCSSSSFTAVSSCCDLLTKTKCPSLSPEIWTISSSWNRVEELRVGIGEGEGEQKHLLSSSDGTSWSGSSLAPLQKVLSTLLIVWYCSIPEISRGKLEGRQSWTATLWQKFNFMVEADEEEELILLWVLFCWWINV